MISHVALDEAHHLPLALYGPGAALLSIPFYIHCNA